MTNRWKASFLPDGTASRVLAAWIELVDSSRATATAQDLKSFLETVLAHLDLNVVDLIDLRRHARLCVEAASAPGRRATYQEFDQGITLLIMDYGTAILSSDLRD